MDPVMLVLRFFHIVAGAAWFGAAFLLTRYVGPVRRGDGARSRTDDGGDLQEAAVREGHRGARADHGRGRLAHVAPRPAALRVDRRMGRLIVRPGPDDRRRPRHVRGLFRDHRDRQQRRAARRHRRRGRRLRRSADAGAGRAHGPPPGRDREARQDRHRPAVLRGHGDGDGTLLVRSLSSVGRFQTRIQRGHAVAQRSWVRIGVAAPVGGAPLLAGGDVSVFSFWMRGSNRRYSRTKTRNRIARPPPNPNTSSTSPGIGSGMPT